MKTVVFGRGYAPFLADLKERIASARGHAARAVNRELVFLYWDIGRAIVEKQQVQGWGEAVIDRLSRDLQKAFPATTGFSPRNLRSMKQLYRAYADPLIWLQPVAKLKKKSAPALSLQENFVAVPWGQHLIILNKVTEMAARLHYLRATFRFGWSRNVLLNQIEAQAYERTKTEKKMHNFSAALPKHLAEQAEEALKSRYNLEFLGIGRAVRERDLEDRLIGRLRDFILELGYGFCFVGRQHRLALGRKEYFVDLLFYHRFLRTLVAFDLKVGGFEPEFTGKMDFYLNLLNDKERGEGDRPSIGIILCAEKDDVEVEFALKTKGNPIGVAEYQLSSCWPAEFKGKLPTAQQLAEVIRSVLPEPMKRPAAVPNQKQPSAARLRITKNKKVRK